MEQRQRQREHSPPNSVFDRGDQCQESDAENCDQSGSMAVNEQDAGAESIR
jgi:hypothetical protein